MTAPEYDGYADTYVRVHALHVQAAMTDVLHRKHPGITLTGFTNHGQLRDLTIIGSYEELNALADLIKQQLATEQTIDSAVTA